MHLEKERLTEQGPAAQSYKQMERVLVSVSLSEPSIFNGLDALLPLSSFDKTFFYSVQELHDPSRLCLHVEYLLLKIVL